MCSQRNISHREGKCTYSFSVRKISIHFILHVALARTLNQNPKIILADEPVASLDPITAKQVMQDFVRINKEYKISILLNIHHVDLALKYCDRVIGIRAGEIVFDGPASTITQEQIDEVYNGAKAPTMGEGEGELPKAARAEG